MRALARLRNVVAWGAAAAVVLGSLTAAPASAAPRERFWETWSDLSEMSSRAPDSARVRIQQRFAADSLDVIAAVLRGRLLASDSLAADALLAETERDSAAAGRQVMRASLLTARGRAGEGRIAWVRARRAYLALGRIADAAQTGIHEALLDRAGRGDPTDPALMLADSLGRVANAPELVATARTLAGTRWQQRDTRRALSVLQQAAALASETGPCYMIAEAERQVAVAFKSLGKLDSARVHYERAVAVARELARPELLARCLHGLGTTLEAEARVPEAERIYRESLAMMPASEHRARANLLGQLGKLFLSAKRYDEARARLKESNAIYDRAVPRAEGHVLNLQHLGQIDLLTGDLDSARQQLERALAEAREFGLPKLEGAILSDLATLALRTGDESRAGQLFDEALAAERKLGRERFVAHLLCARAAVELERGRPEKALLGARDAAQRLRVAEPAGIPTADAIIVRSLLTLGREAEAARAADSARAFAHTRGDSALLARAWGLDAEVQLASGHPAAARDSLALALGVARRLGAPDLLVRLLEQQGQCRLQLREPALAAQSFEEALELQEISQLSLRSEQDRGQVQTRWQELYVQLAIAYRRAGRGSDAFRVVDRCRARGLRERLAEEPPAPRRGAPAAVLRELDSARAALEDAQRRLAAQYALAPEDRSAGLTRLEARCRAARARFSAAQLSLERSAPRYARTAGLGGSFAVSDVRRGLRADEALLAYLVGAERGLVFVITPRELAVRELEVGEATLAVAVDSLLRSLTPGGDAWRRPARDLGGLLIPDQVLASTGRLFISADGPLHNVPFELLRVGERGREQCLVERRVVVMGAAPSLFFHAPPSRRVAAARVAAFGDPEVALPGAPSSQRAAASEAAFSVSRLPYARREAEGIARLFPGARSYVGREATEAKLRLELERAQMLHVAAHGFVDRDRPRFSGLVLARESTSQSDGLLQAYEVLALHGDLELVTLSACETGRGAVQRGEGLLGLARAFQIAGARNLVVSLWPVDDEATADFMLAFYGQLARGDAPAEALTAVKRTWLASADAPTESGSSRGVARTSSAARRSHPSAWAAFVLHGVAGAARASGPVSSAQR